MASFSILGAARAAAGVSPGPREDLDAQYRAILDEIARISGAVATEAPPPGFSSQERRPKTRLVVNALGVALLEEAAVEPDPTPSPHVETAPPESDRWRNGPFEDRLSAEAAVQWARCGLLARPDAWIAAQARLEDARFMKEASDAGLSAGLSIRHLAPDADPVARVVQLHDVALALLHAAAGPGSQEDAERGQLRFAVDILGELEAVLDDGDVASVLSRIYSYSRRRIMESHSLANPSILEEVAVLLASLRDAWAAVERRPAEVAP